MYPPDHEGRAKRSQEGSQRFFFSTSKHCKEIYHSINDCSYPELQLFDSNCVKVCPYETSDSYREEPENTFTSENMLPSARLLLLKSLRPSWGRKLHVYEMFTISRGSSVKRTFLSPQMWGILQLTIFGRSKPDRPATKPRDNALLILVLAKSSIKYFIVSTTCCCSFATPSSHFRIPYLTFRS